MNAADVYSELTALAFVGGGLGWLVDATRPARFAWLAAPRQAYLWLAYLGTLPAYSALSNLPALQSSLSSGGVALTPGMLAVFAVGEGMPAVMLDFTAHLRSAKAGHVHLIGLTWSPVCPPAAGSALVLVVAFHLWLALLPEGCSGTGGSPASVGAEGPPDVESPSSTQAAAAEAWVLSLEGTFGYWRRIAPFPSTSSLCLSASGATCSGPAKPGRARAVRRPLSWRALGLYLLPRLAVLAYFGAWLAALPASGAFHLHLHHYALGWAAASLAAFNHPVSGLLLALGTAVFVQGVGAYGMDPLFKPARTGGCLPVASNSTGQMVCAFWAADPFNLRFCSDTPWIPWVRGSC
jgi:hypothetical protein